MSPRWRPPAERKQRAMDARRYRLDAGSARNQRRAAKLLKASGRAEKRFEREVTAVMRGVHTGLKDAVLRDVKRLEPELRMNGATRYDADKVYPSGLLSRLFVYIRRPIQTAFDRMTKVVDDDNAEALSLFGISPALVPGLGGILASAREEAVRRVQGAAKAYADQVREVLEDPDNFGLRAEELGDLLEDRAKVSVSKAQFIARDTVLKTNGAITKARQTAAGVPQYRWSTSRDERVRPSHAALEGQKFDWDGPNDPQTFLAELGMEFSDPDANAPAEDYQCRCVPIPVIAELEEPETGAEEPAPEEEQVA